MQHDFTGIARPHPLTFSTPSYLLSYTLFSFILLLNCFSSLSHYIVNVQSNRNVILKNWRGLEGNVQRFLHCLVSSFFFCVFSGFLQSAKPLKTSERRKKKKTSLIDVNFRYNEEEEQEEIQRKSNREKRQKNKERERGREEKRKKRSYRSVSSNFRSNECITFDIIIYFRLFEESSLLLFFCILFCFFFHFEEISLLSFSRLNQLEFFWVLKFLFLFFVLGERERERKRKMKDQCELASSFACSLVCGNFFSRYFFSLKTTRKI